MTTFFNFGNDETFHFFTWVTGGDFDVPAMIAEAFHAAETPDNEHSPDEDVCIVVRDKLAARLEDLLADAVPDCAFDAAPEIGNVSHAPGERDRALWLPILACALDGIDCAVVAEALLIQARKWAPSGEIPEAWGPDDDN
jgi:hypothetical protein